MKNFIARVRTADKRLLAVNVAIIVALAAANWGVSHLVGLLVSTHNENSFSEAGRGGYVFGFLMAFVFANAVGRIVKVRDERLGRTKTVAAK